GSKRLRAVRVVVKIEDVGDSLTLSEDAATSEDASLSLHDALPISHRTAAPSDGRQGPKYSGHPPADRFTDPGDHPGGEVRPCGDTDVRPRGARPQCRGVPRAAHESEIPRDALPTPVNAGHLLREGRGEVGDVHQSREHS